MKQPIFIIKFYYQDKMMREIELNEDTLNEATKKAIDIIGGYIPWDRINVMRI